MAIDFDGANDRLESTTVPATAAPLLFAMWVNPDNVTGSQAWMNIGTDGSNNHRFSLWTDSSGLVSAQCRTTSTSTAVSASALSLTTWHHIAAYFESSSSRYAYLDGTAGTQDTGSKTPSGMDRVRFGESMTAITDVNGRAAEAAIYTPATAAEATDICLMLARGYSPLLVRPDILINYWPMWGRYTDEIDLVGGVSLTVTGATYAEHPRVIYPSRPKQIYIPSAVGGDPEGSLIGGKLIRGGLLLHGVLGR